MEAILDIVFKAVGTLVGVGLVCLVNVAVEYVKSKLDANNAARLDAFIAQLVAAAEQTMKQDDFDGSARLAYVQEMLIEAGYELTDAIRAIIESKVYAINLESEYIRED